MPIFFFKTPFPIHDFFSEWRFCPASIFFVTCTEIASMFRGGAPSCEERSRRRRNLTFFLLEGVRHDGTCSGDFRNQRREAERPVDHLRSLRSVAVFPPGGGMRDAKRGEARRGEAAGKRQTVLQRARVFIFLPCRRMIRRGGGREV